jgi:hypothetical protein
MEVRRMLQSRLSVTRKWSCGQLQDPWGPESVADAAIKFSRNLKVQRLPLSGSLVTLKWRRRSKQDFT